MKKVIKKIGNSLGLIFDKEDCKIYNLNKGDIIEIDDLIKLDKKSIKKINLKFSDEEVKELNKRAKELNINMEEYLKHQFKKNLGIEILTESEMKRRLDKK